ncbi:MAG TPA: cupin domain-containing protein [Chitinophagaceae bacterium]|nr:cupin domain-containing protein [Chitinophagaceae bacterium]
MGIVEIFNGKESKVLKAVIPAGKRMPTHYASSEAFVMVTKGKGEIIFSNKEYQLKEGSTIEIPERKPHTLHIIEDFEAYIVLGSGASLEYVNHSAKMAMEND